MTPKNRPIIIGIAGGTGAGKTTFAKSIYHAFGGNEWGGNHTAATNSNTECDITHLAHADYYRDLTHLTMDERACVNFDHPSSLDTDLLIAHLKQLIQGESVIAPRYDYTRHCRFQEGEVDGEGRTTGRLIESKRVILVEGILILSVQDLVQLMDLKVFVDAPSDVRLSRRIQRDTVERGRTLPDILSQYSKTVRPMHNEFVEPSKLNSDLIVYGHHENTEVSKKRMELAMKVICNHLRMETGM